VHWDLQPSPETKLAFNASLASSLGEEQSNLTNVSYWDDRLLEAASSALGPKQDKPRKPWITPATFALIKQKHQLEQLARYDDLKAKRKEVRNALKKDWERWLHEITDVDLDIRDKWMGIKFLKTVKAPKLYERADRHGRCVDFDKQAEVAANYLENVQWGEGLPQEDTAASSNENEPHRNLTNNPHLPRLRNHVRQRKHTNRGYEHLFNCESFCLEELQFLLDRLKKGKASGPDEIPVEFFKWLNASNQTRLLTLINYWWNNAVFPRDKLKAFVASIYKKGDPKKQENYRPISLLNAFYKIYAALIQTRLAQTIDRALQKTQYGFRKSRSTVIPLACVKRICERAEASQDPMFMVFLDWEKAFDRVIHDKLFQALAEMGLPLKYLDAIASLYHEPEFAVKIGGSSSSWKTQKRGIRQGCPLSPYLFIIVMHVLFEEVHDELNLTRARLDNLDFTELMYADDTAVVTNNVSGMNRLLSAIERRAAEYGLKFNRSKCVAMSFNSASRPRFMDGTPVPMESSTKYLGSTISKSHDVKSEVTGRISACFAILNRLNFFWRKANCPDGFKLTVFDAVVRSKLVYGLEVAHIPKFLMQKLNAFQLKGLRKILKLDTTFVDRSNTNTKVLTLANECKNPKHIPSKNIKTFEQYLYDKQKALIKHIVRLPEEDPLRQCTLEPRSMTPYIVSNRRVGRPRGNWAWSAFEHVFVDGNFGLREQFKHDPQGSLNKMEHAIRNRMT